MIQSNKVHEILYGGDYNPEQWGTEELQKDMEYLPQAGVNIVTLNVFNWAMIQPDETHYDFSGLDETVRMVTEKKMKICMATATGAHPAWMAHRHPDILRTEFNGMKRKFGGRHNSCPNSPTFHLYSVRLAAKLAEHYRNQDNIVAWHIGNEYGGICYCENCEKAFRICSSNGTDIFCLYETIASSKLELNDCIIEDRFFIIVSFISVIMFSGDCLPFIS